jgi:hypothetical protein
MQRQSGSNSKNKRSRAGIPRNQVIENLGNVESDHEGNWSLNKVLCPSALNTTVLSVTQSNEGQDVDLSFGEYAPGLTSLRSEASRFHEYRISSAVLIFSPQRGSDATGQIRVRSLRNLPSAGSIVSPGNANRISPLGRSSDVRVPLFIKTDWRSCEGMLLDHIVLNQNNMSRFTLASRNTIDDLIFGYLQVSVTGADTDSVLGSLRIELMPEFRSERV